MWKGQPVSALGLGCVKTFGGSTDARRPPERWPYAAIFEGFSFFGLESRSNWKPAILGGSAWQMTACMRRLRSHRRHKWPDAEDVHDARQIVGQYVQRHLGGEVKENRFYVDINSNFVDVFATLDASK